MSRRFDYRDGFQFWDGPFFSCECEDSGAHLHCDGPVTGEVVQFFHRGHNKRSQGHVRSHWHREGCQLDVDAADGERYSLCPSLGDRVER